MKKEFKFNKNGKIELSKEQLKTLLDDAYWEGYRSGSGTTWTYITPNWTPYYWTTTTATSGATVNSNTSSGTTITLGCNCKDNTEAKL